MDNPEEYIRRDIEGSDVDTRRRAACDLVKVLSKYFEAKIMDIFGAYIQVNIIEKSLIISFLIYIINVIIHNSPVRVNGHGPISQRYTIYIYI